MRVISLCVLTIVFFSCCRKGANQQIDASTIKVIDLLSSPESGILNLSEIATDVTYIPLQTTDSSLIRNIYDVKITNNKIYINTLTEVICFDMKGKYLYKLDKMGRGPGEYQYITDLDFNSDGDLLAFISSGKIFIFNNTEDGFDFSKKLSLRYLNLEDIDFIPGQNSILLSYYSYMGNEPLRNLLINLDGDTLDFRSDYNMYSKIGNLFIQNANENISYKYKNALYFKERFSDTVFSVDQFNILRPHLILDSHGKIPTGNDIADSEYHSEHTHEYIYFRYIFEVSRYLIYRFGYEKKVYSAIHDKILNKKYEVNTETYLYDDITGGVNFEPNFCEKGNFYSWVNVINLKKHVLSDSYKHLIVKYPEKKKALTQLTDSLVETDNPALIVVTPKN